MQTDKEAIEQAICKAHSELTAVVFAAQREGCKEVQDMLNASGPWFDRYMKVLSK